jgi:nitrate/nitrite transport system permease protein
MNTRETLNPVSLEKPRSLVKPRSLEIPGWLVSGLTTLSYALGSLGIVVALWLAARATTADLPSPTAALAVFWELVKSPFHSGGPNDQGVGLLLISSLTRVAMGWGLGTIVAIPLGLAMGAIQPVHRLMNPIVQVLRPVSPLAWYPIALVVLKSAPNALVFAIFITSLWPTVLNTAFGVSSVPRDFQNVARVFNFSRDRYVRRVLLPFALPHIVTGMRVSLGIAWMVIVAAEMLSGSVGIGFFAWDSYNALSYERVLSAIALIGLTGLLFDRGFDWLSKRVSYGQ